MRACIPVLSMDHHLGMYRPATLDFLQDRKYAHTQALQVVHIRKTCKTTAVVTSASLLGTGALLVVTRS